MLSQDDLNNFTIYDVVIPMPGTEIKCPDHLSMAYYNDLLAQEGIDQDWYHKVLPK